MKTFEGTKSKSAKPHANAKAVQAENLVKEYQQNKVLKGVSFSIFPGEKVALLGPNGAGKSTTLRILAGVLAPQSGRVLINGYDLFENPIMAKKNLGYLPENLPQYPELKVIEQLYFAAALKNLSVKASRDSIDELAEIFGLKPVLKSCIYQLSKGFRQRVALAQMMLGNPKFLLLDEPTCGLDPLQMMELRNLIRNLSTSVAILISSHNIFDVEEMCERVIIIHDGSICFDGPIHGATREEKLNALNHLYISQIQGEGSYA